MRVPGTLKLLDLWERASALSPTHRALAILAAYRPDATPDELARLSLGERDGCLAHLRRALFGDEVCFVAACPACAARLESSFALSAVAYGDERAAGAVYECCAGEYAIRFRLPNSDDLLSAVRHTGSADGVALLERCVVEAQAPSGDSVDTDGLPENVMQAVVAEMAALDPGADVSVRLTCPDCGHEWTATFDIAAFLWTEIHVWAQRLLADVHRLALVYGWREADVLALPAWRRQAYLELCRS